MPTKSNKSFDPVDFVKLIASFDTGNPSEAEAMNAGRLMRRSLVTHDLRLVDVMGRTDVMRALDAQLQPFREQTPELKAALLEIAELTEVVRQRDKVIDELQQERIGSMGARSNPMALERGTGLVNDALVASVSLAALVLMIASAFR
jgi:hypothetical protein